MKLLTFFILTIALIFFTLPSGSAHPNKPMVTVEKDPVLETLCSMETSDHTSPAWAVSEPGAAWGECQVKYWSAVHFGGFDEPYRIALEASDSNAQPTRNPAKLFDRDVNRAVATNILDGCREKYSNRKFKILAYCYYSGPNSKPFRSRNGEIYARSAAVRYGHRLREAQWENIRPTMTTTAGLGLLPPLLVMNDVVGPGYSPGPFRETNREVTMKEGKPTAPASGAGRPTSYPHPSTAEGFGNKGPTGNMRGENGYLASEMREGHPKGKPDGKGGYTPVA